MYRAGSNKFLPFIIVGTVIVVAIAALVFLGRLIFGGGPAPTEIIDTSRDDLLNTSLSRSVRMTVRGPIVANEKFTTYRIVISPEKREVTTYEGYLQNVKGREEYGNNVRAYEEFVYALDKASYLKESKAAQLRDDTRGVCAAGRLYEFEILNGGSSVKRLWTSTCSGSAGTFRANVAQVERLFRAQLPTETRIFNNFTL